MTIIRYTGLEFTKLIFLSVFVLGQQDKKEGKNPSFFIFHFLPKIHIHMTLFFFRWYTFKSCVFRPHFVPIN
jgi:hypothetical protein